MTATTRPASEAGLDPRQGGMRLTTHAVDSELGRWCHTEWRPPHLAAVVERLWHFEGRLSLLRERHFATDSLEIILHLGPRFGDVDARGSVVGLFPLACVTGLQLGPFVIEAPNADCCVLGIRLQPAGAYRLFGDALAETTGLSVDLHDLVGRATLELTDRCTEATTVEHRFQLAAAWLAARLARMPDAHVAIAAAVDRLTRSHGNESIAALQRSARFGKAAFAETFRRQVGLTPKRYARVLRFRHALALLRAGLALPDAAFAAGYFDQPHMNGDFRELAGMPPTAILSAVRYPSSLSLAEPA